MITSRHSFSWASRTFRWIPSAHTYTKSVPDRSRFWKASASCCHWRVSRVIEAADNPAPVPRNCSKAGLKSFVDSPCRYSSGNTADMSADLRAHRGKIAEANRRRWPSSSVRLSWTRGWRTRTAPAAVVTSRAR